MRANFRSISLYINNVCHFLEAATQSYIFSFFELRCVQISTAYRFTLTMFVTFLKRPHKAISFPFLIKMRANFRCISLHITNVCHFLEAATQSYIFSFFDDDARKFPQQIASHYKWRTPCFVAAAQSYNFLAGSYIAAINPLHIWQIFKFRQRARKFDACEFMARM